MLELDSISSSPVRRAVQLDDISGAGLLVEPVHVLGDERRRPASGLQPRERLVRHVRGHPAELVPARKAARPVPLPRRLRPHELAEHQQRYMG